MPKAVCEKCGAEMKIVTRDNGDFGTWEKSKRRPGRLGYQRWDKTKARPRYRVVMKCPNSTCRRFVEYSGQSKSSVHAHINRKWNKRRREMIAAEAEERKQKEALDNKRKAQDLEHQASLEG